MLYQIDESSAYIFISSACLIGFLFGLFNWYSVISIELKNEDKDSDNNEIKQINEKTLAKLIEFNKKISDVNKEKYI
jgi:hypothetical protein